ncbi:MAG: hypothetical protein COY22_01955 [Candidatus Tagabacteria bacterium CG_4_10_14_0_2_um_filter_40_13]|uniref:UPF0102 protein CO056_00550 n=1 Tax=Candidatus Tagabacteria bacterium CG_4_9_14_0_2_um_filter_41_11 TaxID=1975019 RepID=A0A2M8ERN6_9BACT|nr:MAG: hypothetical protein COY22_01955 [Candidatus Tagabacteria bacterium CG_4_10_14_0_2_um_filter_40_13]PJC25385.1 MAG: hypothetical protein CO056_00550 [Candidatus Tagabacteria bacterium CG_4_9_14_0_2_um_filter_41_11]
MIQISKQNVGQVGEDVAVKHLVKHSFKILGRNYRKKWGEIDIIAKKDNILHFVEVKSVQWPYNKPINAENFRPEENMHLWKRRRLARTIKTYLSDIRVSDDVEWQVDVIAIFLDFEIKRAKIRVTENIILL